MVRFVRSVGDPSARRRVVLALALSLLGLVLLALPAQRAALAAGDDGRWRSRWLRRGCPLTKRVAFVIDVSGSMRGAPIARARREILTILELGTDEADVRVVAFESVPAVMPGGWRRLPDAERGLREIEEWLGRFTGSGTTDIAAGVIQALALRDGDELSVVLVTDGDANGGAAAHLEAVERAQAARKGGPAPIHVIGVRETAPTDATLGLLLGIAETAGGGCLVIERDDGARGGGGDRGGAR